MLEWTSFLWQAFQQHTVPFNLDIISLITITTITTKQKTIEMLGMDKQDWWMETELR
jgi:hypothetical protein